MARPEKIRIGDVLVQLGVVSQDQLNNALGIQKQTGRRIGRILIETGATTAEKIGEALAQQLSLPYIDIKFFNVDRELVVTLPEAQARRFRAIPLEDRGTRVLVGMSDPTDLFAYDEIARLLKRDIELAVVTEARVLEVIDQVYRRTEQITGLARELEQDLGESVVDFGALGQSIGAEDAPVVKLLQSVFEDAIQVSASDIHLEPQEDKLFIRFRIDGVMRVQTQTDVKIASAVALRLKLMSGLNISEKRMPQDGRFSVRVREQQVDARISTMPTNYGESVVMRLLNRQSALLGLDRLGMPPDMVARFRAILARASGMVLVTGPTGSGKTTTLYAAISELNTPEVKIITVEDPVEYRLHGISQVQVHEKIDLSFTRILRSALRQDPDIIFVGEMRDAETAQIGLRAAITGHLVLSTLHTKDAASTPARLNDMGAPSFMIASSLQSVVAQRLGRVICESCAAPYQPTPQEIEWMRSAAGRVPGDAAFKKGRGCSRCNATGLKGRTGIYEMLEMTGPLVEAASRNDFVEFTRLARVQMTGQTFVQHGLALALAGKTTLAEVMRMAQTED